MTATAALGSVAKPSFGQKLVGMVKSKDEGWGSVAWKAAAFVGGLIIVGAAVGLIANPITGPIIAAALIGGFGATVAYKMRFENKGFKQACNETFWSGAKAFGLGAAVAATGGLGAGLVSGSITIPAMAAAAKATGLAAGQALAGLPTAASSISFSAVGHAIGTAGGKAALTTINAMANVPGWLAAGAGMSIPLLLCIADKVAGKDKGTP